MIRELNNSQITHIANLAKYQVNLELLPTLCYVISLYGPTRNTHNPYPIYLIVKETLPIKRHFWTLEVRYGKSLRQTCVTALHREIIHLQAVILQSTTFGTLCISGNIYQCINKKKMKLN